MRKIAEKLICASLCICMMLTFAGCCCCLPEDALDELSSVTYVGTYTLHEVAAYGITLQGNDIESLTGMDPDDCYIRLDLGGTGEISNGSHTMDIEWDHEEIWPSHDYEDPVAYTVSDGKLTVDWDGVSMTFKKK